MNFIFDELSDGLRLRDCIPEEGDTELIVPEGVVFIHGSAFKRCTKITHLFLPSTVRLDGASAFGKMTALTTISVCPDHPYLTSVDGVLCSREKDSGALCLKRYPTGRRQKSYEPPEQVHAIGQTAFSNAVFLEMIVLHKQIRSVGMYAFSGCPMLRFAKIRCDHLLCLSEGAFRFCPSLEMVHFSGLVDRIGDYAFDGCLSLQHIELPDGLTELCNFVFCRCDSLKSVFLPSSLRAVTREPFYDSDQLEKIYCTGEVAGLIPFYHDLVEIIPAY